MNKSRLLSAACACVLAVATSISHAAAISGQGTWETTLQPRDLDGNTSTIEAYYDTDLGITWLANANYAKTTNYDADGLMTWTAANSWAAGLNPYGSGVTGWRLPNTNPVNGATYNYSPSYNGTTDYSYNVSAPGTTYAGSTGSEMAHLFYNTLGDKGYCTTSSVYPSCPVQAGWGLINTGPFSNVQSYHYGSATEYAPDTTHAWGFDFNNGFQNDIGKAYEYYAWAVHDGDVGTAIATAARFMPWLPLLLE